MNTRGKNNTKFLNEVHKILVWHESSIDQIHITLQMVLTKIQAL